MSDRVGIPPLIACRLAAFARRRRQVALMQAAAEAVLALCMALLLAAVWLAIFRPGADWRVFLSVCVGLAPLAVVAWRGRDPLWRRATPFEVARSLETAAQGRLRERLMSAVEFAATGQTDRGISTWMARETVAIAEREAGLLDPAALVSTAAARRAVWRAALASVAVIVLGFLPWTGALLRLVFDPAGPAYVLARTRLEVAPGDVRMRQGEAIDIQAAVRPWPDAASVEVRWDDGFKERLAMEAIPSSNRFGLRLPNVGQGFGYRVRAGDAESAMFHVRLEAPPRLDRIGLEITSPAYVGGAPRVVVGGDADVLAGSKVRIRAELGGEPARKAWLIVEGASERPVALDGRRAEVELLVRTNLAYGFRLEDSNGESTRPDQQWFLRVEADQPPVVAMTGQGLDEGFASLDEVLLLGIEVRDDLGVGRVSLVSVLNGTNVVRESLPLQFESGQSVSKEARSSAALDLLARRAAKGDELQVSVEATDTAGQVGIAGPVTVQLGSPDVARMARLATRLREMDLRVEIALGQLKEIRASWFALSRSVADDSADARRDLELLRIRLKQWPGELRETGDMIEAEARRASLPVSPTVALVGANLRSWGEGQGRVLQEAADAALASSGTNLVAAFTRGRDLHDRALEDGVRARRLLLTAAVALDAEVLAARSETAQGRYRRALPIVRVSHGLETSVRQGLQAEFFAGVNKSLVFRTNDVPHLDNYEVPGHGRDAWNVRYTGELYVPETGEWTLGALADDGVRLLLDGRAMTPPAAWREHSATEYRTNVALAAGWHPVVLEMYQAGGDSKLRLMIGRPGRQLNEVPRVQLRSPGTDLREIERQVASLSKETLRMADERAVSALGTVAPVSERIASFTNDLPHEGLARLAAETRAPGAFVRTNGPRLADWTLGLSRDLEQKGDALVSAARDARNLLRGELDQLRWKVRGPAALRPLRVAMDELRDSAESLRRIGSADKTRAGKRAAQEREAGIAGAWSRELARAARNLDDRFFDRAREDAHHLSERAADLVASARMEREVGEAARKLDAALMSPRSSPEDMASQVQQNLDRIERALGDVGRAAELGQQGDSSRLATEAGRELRGLTASKGDAAAESRAYAKVRDAVEQVAQSERMRGNTGAADAMERALSNAPQNANLDELGDQLRAVRNALPNTPESVASLAPPPMREQAQAIGRNPEARPSAAEALARPRVALAVEGERARRTGDPGLARGYQRLGHDLGQLIQQPSNLTRENLERLADRAEALAGTRGNEARQQAIADASAQQKPPATEAPAQDAQGEQFAERLDQLAGDSRAAAGESARRPGLMKDLDEMASQSSEEPATPSSAAARRGPSPRSVAAAAAGDASGEIRAAPKESGAYQAAAGTLSDAAERLRIGKASAETAAARPSQEGQAGPAAPGQPSPGGLAGRQGPKGPSGESEGKDTNRDPGDASGVSSGDKGDDQAAWARLSARLRQSVRATGIEHFSEEQQEAIRAYYRRLGEGR